MGVPVGDEELRSVSKPFLTPRPKNVWDKVREVLAGWLPIREQIDPFAIVVNSSHVQAVGGAKIPAAVL